MGGFLTSEKPIQAQFKVNSQYFSDPARSEGIYKGKPYSFCLPIEYSEQNLFPEIRKSAPAFFAEHHIQWHDGQNGKPSNHLCGSLVCCVNFLFPFSDKPNSFSPGPSVHFSGIWKNAAVESGRYVSFEWIGKENYLGEKILKR